MVRRHVVAAAAAMMIYGLVATPKCRAEAQAPPAAPTATLTTHSVGEKRSSSDGISSRWLRRASPSTTAPHVNFARLGDTSAFSTSTSRTHNISDSRFRTNATLLSNMTYRANYTAQYQVLRDPHCTDIPPVISIACSGPNINVLRVSHPNSIVCSAHDIEHDGHDNAAHIASMTCTTNCASDVECEQIYLAIDGDSNEGAFASIDFSCRGTSPDQVEGSVTMQGNTTAWSTRCNASRVDNSRVFHLARLGVSCPITETAATTPASAGKDSQSNIFDVRGNRFEYVFDDRYFECLGGYSLQGNSAAKSAATGVHLFHDGNGNIRNDLYTCSFGNNCNGKACDININNFTVSAEYPAFQDRCIEPPTNSFFTPSLAPVVTAESETLIFTTRFHAAWGFLMDPTMSNACNATTPSIATLSCPHSDTLEVVAIENNWSSIDCTKVASNATRGVVMECIDRGRSSSANAASNFTSLVYECTGPTLPETTLEYSNAAASCHNNMLPATVSHAVQLGVVCDFEDAKGPIPVFSDVLVECSTASHRFENLNASGGSDGDPRFTCLETAYFDANSTASQVQTIASVAIQTDSLWRRSPDKFCYSFTKVTLPPTQTPTAAPSASPTLRPSTAPSLSSAPSQVPSMPVASTNRTNATSSLNRGVGNSGPSTAVITPSTRSNRRHKLIMGASAGGAVVVIGFVMIFVVITLKRRVVANQRRLSVPAQPPDKPSKSSRGASAACYNSGEFSTTESDTGPPDCASTVPTVVSNSTTGSSRRSGSAASATATRPRSAHHAPPHAPIVIPPVVPEEYESAASASFTSAASVASIPPAAATGEVIQSRDETSCSILPMEAMDAASTSASEASRCDSVRREEYSCVEI